MGIDQCLPVCRSIMF